MMELAFIVDELLKVCCCAGDGASSRVDLRIRHECQISTDWPEELCTYVPIFNGS